MTEYLIKIALCSALMLTAYFLFLEKVKMYHFNRFYLLFSLAFSLFVPLITREVSVPILDLQVIVYESLELVNQDSPNIVSVEKVREYNPLGIAFLIVYLSVAGYFLYRFARNIYYIRVKIAENVVVPFRGACLVLLEEDVVSHTFLNHIFINAAQYKKQLVEEELFTHELSHVKQKHSIDILIIEFLQCVLWINPVFILYKSAIETNHEFLADEAVITRYNDVKNYQRLLLHKVTTSCNIQLTHSFNYSITKKRLTMMTKSTNRKSNLLRQLLTIPVLAVGVLLFSTKLEVQAQASTRDKPSVKEVVIGNPIYQSSDSLREVALKNTSNVEKVLSEESKSEVYAEKTPSKFLLLVEETVDGIKISGLKGCAFKTLSFTLADNDIQVIDQYGMSSLDRIKPEKDRKLANFLFKIKKTKEGYSFDRIEGSSAWVNVGFTFGGKRLQYIDDSGTWGK